MSLRKIFSATASVAAIALIPVAAAWERKGGALTRWLTVMALVAVGVLGWSGSSSAAHFPVSTTLWGYESDLRIFSDSRILEYDIGPADAFISSCVPLGSLAGRGLAFDPTDGNLWYTFVDIVSRPGAFLGDGLIHKTTPPPGCAPVTTIPFGDGPGGTVQDAVGALDVDPDDGSIWAAGYQPVGGQSVLYKVNPTTGAIIDSCQVPFGDAGGEGNDTLTEAKLTGLPGSGSYLLTDAGEVATMPNDLLVVDEATCTGGGAGTVVATYPKAVGMTGIDYETKLIATDLHQIFNLGNPPFAPPLATMLAAPSTLEDITLKVGVGVPATLMLAPKTATNTVGTQHCVTATVEDQSGDPVAGITVRFAVSGSVNASGSAQTHANGEVTFCYTGPTLIPGSDVITAYADTDSNGVQNPGEPGDTAAKTWLLPPNTPGCKVTGGGRIVAANGDKATFGGNAMVPASVPKGSEEYQDQGPAVSQNVHSIDVLVVTCSSDGKSASIFGTATINGSGSVDFRIDVIDNGEPGAGTDRYRIRLSTSYDSGDQTLVGGNIQLH
jgi:hypothetical protein